MTSTITLSADTGDQQMKTYIWDEISCEVVEITSPDQVDGGWERQPDDGPVRVFMSDRGHIGLEVDAESLEAAEAAFRCCRPYREAME